MLIKAKQLKGFQLESTDGPIGSAREFYFDDRYWTVRYLIARTAGWLTGRLVLLSPYAVRSIDPFVETVNLTVTKKQIENSPSINSDEPVSRQFEDSYYSYYGYPGYWAGAYAWGYYPNVERDTAKWRNWDMSRTPWSPHLRSTEEVTGYKIAAVDGEIGHVDDFIIDEDTWTIRYLVVTTTNFWPGKKILVSPEWITEVSWEKREVVVDLSRDQIKKAPAYVNNAAVTRDYETGLYGHYDREGYWVSDPVAV